MERHLRTQNLVRERLIARAEQSVNRRERCLLASDIPYLHSSPLQQTLDL
jgi:hypothetical protein